ncbi:MULTISPECIES: hypothetical protein [unclassified Streptomyces]|uniref:hypothetical protein n=1 Tax=unclassified Streptomyces TaxID=2593676 RepID=UPI00101E4159|nr:hypothetical protein [Streptomyces sp. F001]RZB13232.1 hypothetical protein StrepF001_45330 [Streptomyces sp. F001]
MTTSAREKPAVRRLETGWSKARRLRGKAVLRTCLPAVEGPDGPRTSHTGQEWNIVRGED